MLRITRSFKISLMLLSTLSITACNDESVYEAPETADTRVLVVGDIYGSAATGWVVTGVAPGTYDLEFYSKSPRTDVMPYMTANGKMTAITPSSNHWAKTVVKGITVGEDGNCSIVLGNGSSVQVSNMQLVSSSHPSYNLIKGGDISLLSYVEDNGGKYYNTAGQADDCLEILKQSGVNLVRLRLYNDPGNRNYAPSNQLPAGYQDESDVLRLAKRAKEKGMQIQLTLHYSDSWTNGADQNKPHAWANLDFDGLKDAVYSYTADILTKMSAQGTVPEYVSLGNETQAGLLYPDGACADAVKMCALFSAGSKAVRDVAPGSKIIIHSACEEGLTSAETGLNWYFGILRDYGVDYDIMGISLYPFYTNMYAEDMRVLCDRLIETFDKDVIAMETAFAWNQTLPDGFPGQISHNGPYGEFSKLGQRDFIADLSNQIKQSKTGRILGYIYWDPIYIAVPGLGYILGEKNYVSNATLFGFQGESLPVLDAIKFNN